ncbi:O-antigen ligase family protein [Brevundimonas halotolerans]|uniref:O-antigen ligase n=1 Tax=Brevundimonas halotolerans TaxID=69670 RepID=A0A7W9A566_9CAUL|nr:O-antigen ligase family protein [Brevundimonas halotolerans]MBB5661395.1 O-antigen ligase [Brevundimonas halotolerans]
MSGSFLKRISQWNALAIAASVLLAFSLFLGGASREHLVPLAAIELAALLVLGLGLYRLAATGIWRNHRFLLSLAGLAALLPLIQLVPLPFSLWASLPGRESAVTALELAGIAPAWLPLSLTPDRTWQAFLAILPPLAMLIAALGLERRVLARFIWGILGFVILAILVGALQITLNSPAVYPWQTTNFGSLVGFFANRNHMATLCLVAIPFAAALAGSGLNSRDRIANLRLWAGGLVIGLIIVALGAIQSRFGVLAAMPALAAAAMIGWVSSGRSQPGPAILLLILGGAAGLAVVGLFALDPILDRFERDAQFEGRLDNWPIVAQAAQDFLPLGSGMGSFDPVYRSYEPVETLRASYFNQAHNDYLEIWLEAGWAGIALVIATFVWWSRRSWSAWRAGSHPDRDLQRAASVALLLIAAHSAGDYPLRTEAMAVVFALCCAILDGAAQELRPGRSRRRGPSNSVQEPVRRHT